MSRIRPKRSIGSTDNLRRGKAEKESNSEPDYLIPRGWTTARIGEVLRLYNGAPFKPTDWSENGLPIIRIQNLNNPEKAFNYFAGELHPRFRVRKGDLLFAWSGTPGTSFGAHIWTGEDAWLNQHIFRVEFPPELFDSEFLRLAINRNLQAYIAEAHGGAGLAHITKGKFESFTVLLPPLAEQRRIVARLEALVARSRRARVILMEIPVQLARARQSLIAAAYRGDLTADWRKQNQSALSLPDTSATRKRMWIEMETEKARSHGRSDAGLANRYTHPAPLSTNTQLSLPPIPNRWSWLTLEAVSVRFRYGTSAKSKATGAIPVLRMGNLQQGEIDWSKLVYTDDEDEIKEYALPANSVLFNRTNSPELVGKCALYRGDRPAIFAGYLIHIELIQEIAAPFLNYFLQSSFARQWCWFAKSDGVSQSNISASTLAKMPFVLAPIAEQNEIVRRLDEALARLGEASRAQAAAVSELDRLDQSLVARAFSGALVLQNPIDEPAATSLARVLQQKAREPKIPKIRMLRKSKSERASGPKRSIVDVFKSEKELSAESLFRTAGRDGTDLDQVEAFYAELRQFIDEGIIVERRPDNSSVFLSAKR